MEKSIFSQIISRELPADIVFENERIIAIKDIHPAAPVHLLIISKKEISNLQSVTDVDLPLIGEMMKTATELAKEFHVEGGYRLLTNIGPASGQIIYHLHFHLLGGRQLGGLG
jgi:histidine triad (HIT) family protein